METIQKIKNNIKKVEQLSDYLNHKNCNQYEIEKFYHKNLIIRYLQYIYKDIIIDDSNYVYYFNHLKNNNELNKLHFFKKRNLPRLQPVLYKLNYLFYPKTVNHLDIGFNRGTSLYEILNLDGFIANTTAIDIDKYIVEWNQKILGSKNLNFKHLDILNTNFEDNSFEVITCLEVLEHIENWKGALKEIIRLSNNLIILSVPSKEDNNPEHINFLTKNIFKGFFRKNNIFNYHFKYTLNHLIIFIKK